MENWLSLVNLKHADDGHQMVHSTFIDILIMISTCDYFKEIYFRNFKAKA